MAKSRNSNFEILRIFAMILIIAHHFSVHGAFNFGVEELSINRFWIQLLQMGGKLGVNIFVLITGYFSIKAEKIRIEKILSFCGQLIFYAVLIYLIFAYFTDLPFATVSFLRAFFPITYDEWWFASAYFVLYLFSPYINRFLGSLSRADYRKLLMLMGFLWCVIPTVTDQLYQSNHLIWFIFLYSLAGYLKLYPLRRSHRPLFYFAIAAGAALLTFLSAVLLDYAEAAGLKLLSRATYFFDLQKAPMLLIALALFLGFAQATPRYIKAINVFSSAMFGVYLIHDHDYVRKFLWLTLFRNASFSQSDLLIPLSLVAVFAVLLGCAAIDLVRLYAIEHPAMRLFSLLKEKCQQKKAQN